MPENQPPTEFNETTFFKQLVLEYLKKRNPEEEFFVYPSSGRAWGFFRARFLFPQKVVDAFYYSAAEANRPGGWQVGINKCDRRYADEGELKRTVELSLELAAARNATRREQE